VLSSWDSILVCFSSAFSRRKIFRALPPHPGGGGRVEGSVHTPHPWRDFHAALQGGIIAQHTGSHTEIPRKRVPFHLCRRTEGTILIADVNVAPTLEANGLVFHAAAQVGLTHAGLLHHLVSNECERQGLPLPGLLPVISAESTFFARKEESQVGLLCKLCTRLG